MMHPFTHPTSKVTVLCTPDLNFADYAKTLAAVEGEGEHQVAVPVHARECAQQE